MDSARQNLASSFVNGFVNAAFGQDKLLTEDGNKWIYKHNDHGTSSGSGISAIGFCPPPLWVLLDDAGIKREILEPAGSKS